MESRPHRTWIVGDFGRLSVHYADQLPVPGAHLFRQLPWLDARCTRARQLWSAESFLFGGRQGCFQARPT